MVYASVKAILIYLNDPTFRGIEDEVNKWMSVIKHRNKSIIV